MGKEGKKREERRKGETKGREKKEKGIKKDR